MRIGLFVFAMATLAASTAAVADTAVAGQAVQGAESVAVTSATPTPIPEVTAVDAIAQPEPEPEPEPAAASGPGPVADAESHSTAPPAVADPATPDDASASQPITLKMATVPPPADFKIPAGYRPVKRGLDTVYCTSITPIGSRMPQTYCMSRQQVEQVQRQAESDRQMLKEKARTGGTSGG